MEKPTFDEYKEFILATREIGIAPVDDFEMFAKCLTIRYWRVRLHFRPWLPFYFWCCIFTDAKLREMYSVLGGGFGYPPNINIQIGAWRTRYDRWSGYCEMDHRWRLGRWLCDRWHYWLDT